MGTHYVTDYEVFAPIFTRRDHERELDCIAEIRFKLIEFRYAEVGHEWDSGGTPRTDVFHHIDFVQSGCGQVWDDINRLRLKEGQIIWLPANSLYHTQCERPMSVYFLRMRCEWLAGLDPFWGWHQPLCLGEWDPARLVPQWSIRPLPLEAHWQLQGLLHQALAGQAARFADHMRRQMDLYANFGAVFELIDRRLSAQLRVVDLAEAQGVSLNGFTRLFRRHFGVAPKTYLNRRLNQEACDLLLSTDLSVDRVARRLEFSDDYYFYRFFLKMNNLSPRHYRQQMRGQSAGARNAGE